MTELRILIRHAGTVLVGQLAVMAFGVTDTIVAGRYSQEALAALSVGSAMVRRRRSRLDAARIHARLIRYAGPRSEKP